MQMDAISVAPVGEIEALALPEADSETTSSARGSGRVQHADLREVTRAGWLGVQLATASEPAVRQRRIWGVALASTSATPEL